jgi:hypothetical protein
MGRQGWAAFDPFDPSDPSDPLLKDSFDPANDHRERRDDRQAQLFLVFAILLVDFGTKPEDSSNKTLVLFDGSRNYFVLIGQSLICY